MDIPIVNWEGKIGGGERGGVKLIIYAIEKKGKKTTEKSQKTRRNTAKAWGKG